MKLLSGQQQLSRKGKTSDPKRRRQKANNQGGALEFKSRSSKAYVLASSSHMLDKYHDHPSHPHNSFQNTNG
jgi:hypothetical protein